MSEAMFIMGKPGMATAAGLRLLLLKCVLSNPETSSEAFAEWENAVVFDDLDFQSLRLLPLVYVKLLENDLKEVNSFLRIKSIYRRTWTENKVLLSNLDAIFAIFNKSDLPFIIAEEALRVLEIYDDRGVYSLQDFSILAPVSRKRDYCKTLSENFWHLQDDGIETTRFKKENLFSINLFWKIEEEFSYFRVNSEGFPIGNHRQLILCPEEQILNLCASEFLIFEDEQIKWKIISAILFNAQQISISKLLASAQTRGLSDALMKMLKTLSDHLNIEVSHRVLDSVVKSAKSKKNSGLIRSIRLLGRTYKMHAEFENQKATLRDF